MNSLFNNIDFNVVENVIFTDREVDVVFDNNIKVWERKNEQPSYTILEYITSNNGGYFETNYIPTLNTKISTTVSKERNGYPLFGERIAGGQSEFSIYPRPIIHGKNQYIIGFANQRITSNTIDSASLNYVNSYELSKDGAFVNGEKLADSFTSTTNFNLPLTINALNQNGTISLKDNTTRRLYDFKIYENDNLIHYFKPSIRSTDNVIGLYDDLTDTFLESQGLGFSAPEEQNIYAKFDGASYFDTNFIISSGTQNIDVKCGVYIDEKPTTLNVPFGARYYTGSTYYTFAPFHITGDTQGWRVNLGKDFTVTAMTTQDKTEYEIELAVSGGSTSKTCAFEVYDKTNNLLEYESRTAVSMHSNLNSRPLYVGALNDGAGYKCYFTKYIKYVAMYRNEALEHYFVFKEIEGVVKMYDTVTDTYYDNLGTGSVSLVDINTLNN